MKGVLAGTRAGLGKEGASGDGGLLKRLHVALPHYAAFRQRAAWRQQGLGSPQTSSGPQYPARLQREALPCHYPAATNEGFIRLWYNLTIEILINPPCVYSQIPFVTGSLKLCVCACMAVCVCASLCRPHLRLCSGRRGQGESRVKPVRYTGFN